MSGIRPRIAATGQQVAIERGELRLEVCLRPFHSPALRTPPDLAGSVWVAEGTVRDRFIRLTEGVLAHEELLPQERAAHGAVADATLNRVELIVALHGGRRVRLAAAIGEAEDVRLELSAPIQRYAWLWNGIAVPTSASSAWARHGAVAPLDRILVWAREGSVVVTYPVEHVRTGLGDTPESERPLLATLWGRVPRARSSFARW